MNRGCRNFKQGDIVKGLKLISEPYKINGDKNYRGIVQCTLCDRDPYEIVLSEINRHVFDGCGCKIDRSNSPRWKSFYDWCIENNRIDLLDLWDYELNNKVPQQVSSCTTDMYYFKCSTGEHESTLHRIDCITTKYKNKKICTKCNSFAYHAIKKFGEDVLDLYWDYDKNIVSPWEITYNSKESIWIKCIDTDYHGSYETTPTIFFKVEGKCPYCYHRRIHPRDSFAYYCIQKYGDDFLNLYWDYDKNTVDPWNIAPQSNVYIYLKCDIHGSYKIYASSFYKHGTLCAECSRERDKSKLQGKVERYVEEKYHLDIAHEYSCSIIAKSSKTERFLPYDNDIEINNNHLIIEVMGEQHYNKNAGWIRKKAQKRNTTNEEIISDLQWRDEYKKQYALSQGYYYLAIPYWTENDESYKTLIDDKIQSILTIQN